MFILSIAISPQHRLCPCPGEYRGPPFALEMKSKDAPKQKTYLYCIPIYGHFQAMTVHTFGGPKSVRQSLASIALARASSMPVLPGAAPPPVPPTAAQASAHNIKTTRYRGFSILSASSESWSHGDQEARACIEDLQLPVLRALAGALTEPLLCTSVESLALSHLVPLTLWRTGPHTLLSFSVSSLQPI